ncbi:MAG: hypothetical protein Q8R18_06245 [bacterium]|nr:hypothetical protein [bacterium]
MADKIIFDVDLASDVKSLFSSDKDITFTDLRIKDTVFNLDDDVLVRVGKSISSLKIISIDIIDVDYLKTVLGGEDSDESSTPE